MPNLRLRLMISLVPLLILIIHLAFPDVTMDAATLALLLVAGLPWAAPLIRSIEIPNVIKIELQDLEKAKEKANQAGLLIEGRAENKVNELRYAELLANEDPNLALAALRIDIERRLRTIAEKRGISSQRQSVGQLLRVLSTDNVLSFSQRSILADLVGTLNSAVHGADVSPEVAEWAVNVGPQILEGLDQIIADLNNAKS